MKFSTRTSDPKLFSEKLNSLSGWIVCILIAAIMGLIASASPYKGAELIGVIAGISALLLCMISAEVGLYLITLFNTQP